MKKTNELVNEKCSKKVSKRKKLQRSHTKEKSCALELKQSPSDLQELTKVRSNTLRITVEMGLCERALKNMIICWYLRNFPLVSFSHCSYNN